MNNYECWEINGNSLEYFDDEHQYIVNGICVPSITQILKVKFGNKYSGVDNETLKRASEMGTAVHKAIEEYCKEGIESEYPELRNFKFLKKKFNFDVLENEVPVILFFEGVPLVAGRLDLVLMEGERTGLADIKRTSTLDKEYLAYQLNLYRIAYRQSYGIEADFLKGIHLREQTRKYVDIPINENKAWELIEEYLEGENNE